MLAAAARPLPYRIRWVSSESEYHPAQELELGSETPFPNGGWCSARQCDYPQELEVNFDEEVSLQEVRILAHESRIPKEVQLYVGDPPGSSPDRGGKLPSSGEGQAGDAESQEQQPLQKMARLGHVTFSDNAASQFQAREQKAVEIDAVGRCLRLVLHAPHGNSLNRFDQVGIVSLQVVGRPAYARKQQRRSPQSATPGAAAGQAAAHPQQQFAAGHPARPEASSPPPPLAEDAALSLVRGERARRRQPDGYEIVYPEETTAGTIDLPPAWGQASVVDKVLLDAGIDPGLVAASQPAYRIDKNTHLILQDLERKKAEAVESDDFETAVRLRETMGRVLEVGSDLVRLDRAKREAIEREDYDAAHDIKLRMFALDRERARLPHAHDEEVAFDKTMGANFAGAGMAGAQPGGGPGSGRKSQVVPALRRNPAAERPLPALANGRSPRPPGPPGSDGEEAEANLWQQQQQQPGLSASSASSVSSTTTSAAAAAAPSPRSPRPPATKKRTPRPQKTASGRTLTAGRAATAASSSEKGEPPPRATDPSDPLRVPMLARLKVVGEREPEAPGAAGAGGGDGDGDGDNSGPAEWRDAHILSESLGPTLVKCLMHRRRWQLREAALVVLGDNLLAVLEVKKKALPIFKCVCAALFRTLGDRNPQVFVAAVSVLCKAFEEVPPPKPPPEAEGSQGEKKEPEPEPEKTEAEKKAEAMLAAMAKMEKLQNQLKAAQQAGKDGAGGSPERHGKAGRIIGPAHHSRGPKIELVWAAGAGRVPATSPSNPGKPGKGAAAPARAAGTAGGGAGQQHVPSGSIRLTDLHRGVETLLPVVVRQTAASNARMRSSASDAILFLARQHHVGPAMVAGHLWGVHSRKGGGGGGGGGGGVAGYGTHRFGGEKHAKSWRMVCGSLRLLCTLVKEFGFAAPLPVHGVHGHGHGGGTSESKKGGAGGGKGGGKERKSGLSFESVCLSAVDALQHQNGDIRSAAVDVVMLAYSIRGRKVEPYLVPLKPFVLDMLREGFMQIDAESQKGGLVEEWSWHDTALIAAASAGHGPAVAAATAAASRAEAGYASAAAAAAGAHGSHAHGVGHKAALSHPQPHSKPAGGSGKSAGPSGAAGKQQARGRTRVRQDPHSRSRSSSSSSSNSGSTSSAHESKSPPPRKMSPKGASPANGKEAANAGADAAAAGKTSPVGTDASSAGAGQGKPEAAAAPAGDSAASPPTKKTKTAPAKAAGATTHSAASAGKSELPRKKRGSSAHDRRAIPTVANAAATAAAAPSQALNGTKTPSEGKALAATTAAGTTTGANSGVTSPRSAWAEDSTDGVGGVGPAASDAVVKKLVSSTKQDSAQDEEDQPETVVSPLVPPSASPSSTETSTGTRTAEDEDGGAEGGGGGEGKDGDAEASPPALRSTEVKQAWTAELAPDSPAAGRKPSTNSLGDEKKGEALTLLSDEAKTRPSTEGNGAVTATEASDADNGSASIMPAAAKDITAANATKPPALGSQGGRGAASSSSSSSFAAAASTVTQAKKKAKKGCVVQ